MTPTGCVIDLCIVFEHAVIYKVTVIPKPKAEGDRPLKPIGRHARFWHSPVALHARSADARKFYFH